jgi:hypothetical protein
MTHARPSYLRCDSLATGDLESALNAQRMSIEELPSPILQKS